MQTMYQQLGTAVDLCMTGANDLQGLRQRWQNHNREKAQQ